ncbi:MAG: PRC-barrel domain-containing protein [archaeon]
MTDERKYSRHLVGKTVVTKSGKKFGEVGNITFETRTGELMQIVLKNPTVYVDNLDIERDKKGNWLIPFSAVMAVGDFVVVAEEDII